MWSTAYEFYSSLLIYVAIWVSLKDAFKKNDAWRQMQMLCEYVQNVDAWLLLSSVWLKKSKSADGNMADPNCSNIVTAQWKGKHRALNNTLSDRMLPFHNNFASKVNLRVADNRILSIIRSDKIFIGWFLAISSQHHRKTKNWDLGYLLYFISTQDSGWNSV